jgi:segregation and condensation protein B
MTADPKDLGETPEHAGATEVPETAEPREAAPEAVAEPLAGSPGDEGAGVSGSPVESAADASAAPEPLAESAADAGAAPEPPAGSAAPAPAGSSVSADELQALQAAEEAKAGDPALDEVESADIDVADEKEEPFEKLAAAAKRLSADRVRTVIETLLFLSEKPLSVEEIRLASGVEVERIEKALDRLSGHYREGPCGIVLHEVAGGWQLRTSPDNVDFARRFLKVKPQRLTRAALETLAIIAYRQPVTRPEIEDIRGVDCGAVVKALLERRLIKILGKKEEPGRPMLYGTSREFLEFFALKDLASLPTLREFHELSQENRSIVEKDAPPQEPIPAGIAGIVEDLEDPALRAELEAKRAEADAALDELERAIEAADEKSRAARTALGDKKQDEPEPELPPGEGG